MFTPRFAEGKSHEKFQGFLAFYFIWVVVSFTICQQIFSEKLFIENIERCFPSFGQLRGRRSTNHADVSQK